MNNFPLYYCILARDYLFVVACNIELYSLIGIRLSSFKGIKSIARITKIPTQELAALSTYGE